MIKQLTRRLPTRSLVMGLSLLTLASCKWMDTTVFTDDFDRGDLSKWTSQDVSSARHWVVEAEENNRFAAISCADTTEACNDWLIAKKLDLRAFRQAKISFNSANIPAENASAELSLKASLNYRSDAERARWFDLSDSVEWSNGQDGEWQASGDVDLTRFAGHIVTLAFQYKAPATSEAKWLIDDVLVSGESFYRLELGANIELPKTTVYAGESFTLEGVAYNGIGEPYTYIWNIGGELKEGAQIEYTFETAGDYSITLNVADESGAATSQTETLTVVERPIINPVYLNEDFDADPLMWTVIDQGEALKNWRRTGGGFIEANCYRGAEDCLDWIVKTVDLNNAQLPQLKFDSAQRFGNDPLNQIRVMVSTDFTDNVDAATWVDLSSFVTWATNDEFTNSGLIELADFKNTQLTLAFVYQTPVSGATRWRIDNVQIAEKDNFPVDPVYFEDDFSAETLEWLSVDQGEPTKNWTLTNADYVEANCYRGTEDCKDYLIQTIDLSRATNPELSFQSATRYGNNAQDQIKLLVSTNFTGDVDSANWIDLSGSAAWASSDSFSDSGLISLTDYIGTEVSIAFLYTTPVSGAARWRIDNVRIAEPADDNDDGGDDDDGDNGGGDDDDDDNGGGDDDDDDNGGGDDDDNGGDDGTVYLNEDFQNENLTWTIVDRGEANKNWTRTPAGYMEANCYQGTENCEEWLLKTIDLTAANQPLLQFESARRYGNDPLTQIQVLVSTNFSGDVTTSTWSDLSDLATWATSDSFKVSGTINLSEYRQNLTLAFVYKTTVENATRWRLDNVVVGEPSVFEGEEYNFEDYYADAIGKTGQALRDALNITSARNHQYMSYASVWEALFTVDEDPLNPDNVLLIYTGRSQAKSEKAGGTYDPDAWNREHTWPKSRGFPSRSSWAHNDIHHLRPADASVNSKRSNKAYDDGGEEIGEAPGNFTDSDSFEPRDQVKGDLARQMFYLAIRYNGNDDTGVADLVLVNFTTYDGPQMGRLCALLEWHNADPVSEAEQRRHNKVVEVQGNRNPFIDNPAWAQTIWGEQCNHTAP